MQCTRRRSVTSNLRIVRLQFLYGCIGARLPQRDGVGRLRLLSGLRKDCGREVRQEQRMSRASLVHPGQPLLYVTRWNMPRSVSCACSPVRMMYLDKFYDAKAILYCHAMMAIIQYFSCLYTWPYNLWMYKDTGIIVICS